MEDPLRHKTVPLAAETVFWFEFLLDPTLLTKHLAKPHPVPTPINLIAQFLSVPTENQTNQSVDLTTPELESSMNNDEGLKIMRKQLGLKVLILKVAAFLKWDLDNFEKNLPLQKQVQLLSDLCCVTCGKCVSLPLSLVHDYVIGPEGSKQAFNFALTLYHRWVLRAQVLREAQTRTIKQGFAQVLTAQEQMNSTRDELFVATLEPFVQTSIEFLLQVCAEPEDFKVLSVDSFYALNPTSDRTAQNFDHGTVISKTELKTQISFELCLYYLYVKKYELAREQALSCRNNLAELKRQYESKKCKEFVFCKFDEADLNGYMLACGVGEAKLSLVERMNVAILNDYQHIVEIFKEDNVAKEIPLVNRRIVELDIEGAISEGILQAPRELFIQVAAVNLIRSILEEESIFATNDFFKKFKDGIRFFVAESKIALPTCSLSDKNKMRKYFMDLILSQPNGREIADSVKEAQLFTDMEVADMLNQRDDEIIALPEIALQVDWSSLETKNNHLEIGSMERQMVTSSNAITVRRLLVKLANTNPQKPLWAINLNWDIPVSVKNVLMSMPRGFLQDFFYILIGKGREFAVKDDYAAAISMFTTARAEAQRGDLQTSPYIVKLSHMLNWEILLVQILKAFEEWNRKPLDAASMITRCKQCLVTLQNGDNLVPRSDILDHCAAMLLNLSEWSALLSPDKRGPNFPILELTTTFSSAVLDMEKFKGTKKVSRDAWDLILPMFNMSSGSKRGGGGSMLRDSPGLMATVLNSFLKKLRDPLIISVVLSLLARLYNCLKDEANFDLQAEYMHIWPTSVTNAKSYSIRVVSETLYMLLRQSLKFYPHHISWIRLLADLEFANGNNEAAMKCYINCLITGTEYCTMNLQPPLLNEFIVKRMIKCSSALGCYIEAAVLCQFLDEIDYALAFKCISEKVLNVSDAMDAYYNCIWDATLLEFIINWHSKKGEHTRKQYAMSIMGQLELNANNNEEIKREAATIRKTRFLRALAKQYML